MNLQDAFNEFFKITKLINKIGATPLLYGSVGLAKSTGLNFTFDDIDMLIEESFVSENWDAFKNHVEDNSNYKLIDLKEHTFSNGDFKIAFAKIEGMKDFAGIEVKDMLRLSEKGAEFYELRPAQFLKIYKASSINEYRKKIQKNDKDLLKVKILEKYIKENKK